MDASDIQESKLIARPSHCIVLSLIEATCAPRHLLLAKSGWNPRGWRDEVWHAPRGQCSTRSFSATDSVTTGYRGRGVFRARFASTPTSIRRESDNREQLVKLTREETRWDAVRGSFRGKPRKKRSQVGKGLTRSFRKAPSVSENVSTAMSLGQNLHNHFPLIEFSLNYRSPSRDDKDIMISW